MSCESKYRSYQIGPDEAGFIRIVGRVYPVTINRIADPEKMDRIWRPDFTSQMNSRANLCQRQSESMAGGHAALSLALLSDLLTNVLLQFAF